MTERRSLTRRHFLRGAVSGALAIPFLPSLVTTRARADGDDPMRFVFIGGHFGRALTEWYPEVEPTEEVAEQVWSMPLRDIQNADGHISPIFSDAWEGLRDKFSIVRGLDGMQVAGDAHRAAMALTGSGQVNGQIGFPYSIDAVMEESPVIYPEVPFAGAVRACPTPNSNRIYFSYSSQSGRPQSLLPDFDPYDTYTRLFHPATLDARSARAIAQRPVLNEVMEDYRALVSSPRISADDRYKLEAHLSMVSDIEGRLGVSSSGCMGAVEPGSFADAESMHETAMDLAVAALTCDLTRVVTHAIVQHDSHLAPNDEEAHSAAHNGRSSEEASGSEPVDQWVMNRWSMRQVGRFIEKLDAVVLSEGVTLLDRSIVVYGNCESRGFHTFYDMPVIVAGAPDRFRLGEYIDYRPRPIRKKGGLELGRPYNHLLTTVLQAMGLAPEDYHRFETTGFGVYDGHATDLGDHYAPYLLARDATLPWLYRG